MLINARKTRLALCLMALSMASTAQAFDFSHVAVESSAPTPADPTPFTVSAFENEKPAAAIPTLHDLEGWRPEHKGGVTETEPSLRERALKETALQVGSQAALALRTREQNAEVETFAPWLNEIYRFDQLLTEKGVVLPPVVIEARRSAEVSGQQLTKIEQSYKMLENAQVVSAPPTWRDFLIAEAYPPPARPEGPLLPQNAQEEGIWKAALGRGWEQGERQAWLAFRARVGELHRAFLGRVRYWVLLERQMVTAPVVRVSRRGVRQEGNELLIGRTDITLTRLCRFGGPTKKNRLAWQAVPEVLTTYDDGSSVE